MNKDEIKTFLVEKDISCPMCGKELKNGDIMKKDEYRNETFCGYCEDEYKEAIIREEGKDGRLLK